MKKLLSILFLGCISLWMAADTYAVPHFPYRSNTYDLGKDTRSWQELYMNTNIVAEGSTEDGSETTFAFTNPTRDNTITVPDGTGTVSLTNYVRHDFNGTNGTWTLNTNEIQASLLEFANGTTTGNTNVIITSTDAVPGKEYFVYNNTVKNIVFKVDTGTGTTIISGDYVRVAMNDTPDIIWSRFTNLKINSTIIAEGSTSDSQQTTLSFTDPTRDNTIVIPDGTGTVNLYGNLIYDIGATSTTQTLDTNQVEKSRIEFTNGTTNATVEIGTANANLRLGKKYTIFNNSDDAVTFRVNSGTGTVIYDRQIKDVVINQTPDIEVINNTNLDYTTFDFANTQGTFTVTDDQARDGMWIFQNTVSTATCDILLGTDTALGIAGKLTTVVNQGNGSVSVRMAAGAAGTGTIIGTGTGYSYGIITVNDLPDVIELLETTPGS